MDINTHSTLKTNLVAYWTLDANMNDSSGNGYNGTLYDTPTFPVAKLRTGMRLNGTSQYGSVLATSFMPASPTDHSVSFWFCADTWDSNKLIFSAGNPGDAPRLRCYTVTGGNRLEFYTRAGSITTATTFSAGVWYHVMFVVENASDHGSYWAYINGVVDSNINGATWSWGQPTPASTGDIFLGYRPGYSEGYFAGKIDEFACWNKKLSSGERTDLYQSGLGITWDGTFTSIKTHPTLRSGLLAHYKFDGSLVDEVGGYNGSWWSTPQGYITGKLGQGVYGTNNGWVRTSNSSALNPAQMTLVCWAKRPTGNAWGWQAKRGSGTSHYELGFNGNPGSSGMYWKVGRGGYGETMVYLPCSDANWHFYAGSYDGSSVVKASVDNGTPQTTSWTYGITGNTEYLESGWNSSASLQTACDSLSIYDRVLAASEITDLYNSGNGLYYETGIPASGTFTSAQSGPWSDPTTWGDVNYPGDGSTVTIAAGHTVTIDGSHTCGTAPTDDTTMVLTINNTGWLKWTDNPSSSWTFTIKGNVNIVKGGKFSVGTASVPIPAAQTATVYFPSVNTTGWKIQANGTLEAYGAEAYHMASASMQRSKLVWNMTTGTGVTLKLADAVDWQAGDTVSISNRENAANLETLVIQSKIDAYTYTVNTSYVHLIDDFAVLVNRNVKFLGYDNAGRGVTIYVYHTSALAASGSVINLSWCSFKYFGRQTSTTLGTQALYYHIVASSPAGASLPDANFKLVGVVFDELSNSSPDGTVYLNSDIAFNGTSYRLDGVHFTGAMTKRCVYISIDGVTKLRGVTATYVQGSTGNYAIFGRWGDVDVDELYFCGGASSTPGIWGYARRAINCHFCGGAYGIYYYHAASGVDNYPYMMVNESVVDNCKFISMTIGIAIAQNNVNCFGMTCSVYAKNSEFFGCGSNAVWANGQSGRIRIENCTIDGVGSYSSTETFPFGISTGCNTDIVIAGCTIGRLARSPNTLVYYDGLNPSNKISVVGCEVYQPWSISGYEYQDWLYYALFRITQYHTSYECRWRTNPHSPASATGCRIWLGDGSGRNELFSMMQRYRRLNLAAGAELRDQLTNIDTGKMPLRIIPFSPNVDPDLNKRTPIKINATPNKRLTASLKFKNIGTNLRTRASMRLYGGGIFSKARMTAAVGEWQTLTVLGDCNPNLTEGVSHLGIASDLVGYWALNGNALDSHTGHLDGSLVGSPSFVAGKMDRAVSMNGSSQGVSIANNANFNTNTMSIACWVKATSYSSWHTIVAKGGDTGTDKAQFQIHIHDSQDKYYFEIRNAEGTYFDAFGDTVVTGRWDFLVGTFDGSYLRFYQNGVLKQTTAFSGTREMNTFPITVGYRSGSYPIYFNGCVSDVALFNRALTPVEIASIYRLGRGLRYHLTKQYQDTMQVNLILSAGTNNYDFRERYYTDMAYAGRVMYWSSGGPTGMQDAPALKIAVDVDTLSITESSIP